MEKVSISNLAWPQADAAKATAYAVELGFQGIEIAPARIFPGWPDAEAQARPLRRRFEELGLSIPALQGILFGARGVELFASAESRSRLSAHLGKVARLAGELGAGACVYGAPRARDPGNLAKDEAVAIAIDFFGAVARLFEREGTCLAFEANAPDYGCRFVTRTAEAMDLVARVRQIGFGLQIDTGTFFLTGEAPKILRGAGSNAAHFHVSEPELSVLGTSGVDHGPLGEAMRLSGYEGWISVEMRESNDWRKSMADAADIVRTHYWRDAG